MNNLFMSGFIYNIFYWFLFILLCRQVSGMADETGNPNPLGPMDTEGDKDVTATEAENLLKDADSLLNSSSTRKAPNPNNTGSGPGIITDTGAAYDTGTVENTGSGEKSRSVSVTSRFNNLDLSTNPGVPYQAVIDKNRARTHSGLTFGTGTGTGNGAAGIVAGGSDTGNKRG
jgi:hypothetical protein